MGAAGAVVFFGAAAFFGVTAFVESTFFGSAFFGSTFFGTVFGGSSVTAGPCPIAPNGKTFDQDSIGMALATRNLLHDLRGSGEITGGPKPFAPRDRSEFLSALDRAIVRIADRLADRGLTIPPPLLQVMDVELTARDARLQQFCLLGLLVIFLWSAWHQTAFRLAHLVLASLTFLAWSFLPVLFAVIIAPAVIQISSNL